ncbi:hypothetical protein ACS0TY_018864 [Phlomoides rotata]
MAAPSPSLSKHSFFYDTFTQMTPGLIYQGGTHVLQGSTFLRLTQTDTSGMAMGNSAGRVLYLQPIKLQSFETTLTFKIKPSSDGAADGLAFFIAPVNTTIPSGATGGNLGIFHSAGTTSSLFAVEFDTYVNEAWDPKDRHIGIDINSRKSVSTTSFDSGTGELVTAQIYYNSKTTTISVVATSGKQTASLSYVFDLKTILPQQVQVGISSAAGETGTGLGVHDVMSWYFRSYDNEK